LPGEPVLVPYWLHDMDGNNPMKQVDGSGHADQHVFISDYLIPLSKVDKFKNDVKTCPGVQNQSSSSLPHGHEKTWYQAGNISPYHTTIPGEGQDH
jgi:hypothetical protein